MAEEKKPETKEVGKKGKGLKKAAPGRALTPFEEMEDLMARMDRLFEDFFPGRWRGERGMTPFREMERRFEDIFPRGWLRPFRRDWPSLGGLAAFEERWPRVDVLDKEDAIVVRAEVPGADKDDIDVSLSEDAVTIKGEISWEEEEEEEGFYRRETSRGAFSRVIPLPVAVDDSKAKAAFKSGILELTLPKVEKTKRRRIKVE